MDFKTLFLSNIPLIDVRAPVEFQAGHFPNSTNLPLMNNEERHLVGTCYQEKGQAAAIELGHQLVEDEIKEERIQNWLKFLETHAGAKLYCFRGGLRSEISLEWIASAAGESFTVPEKVPGGFKALRRFLLENLEKESLQHEFIILSGKTGSGKTKLLQKLTVPYLDLERHANHRGSSFGHLGAQPAQVTFENRVSVDLLKLSGAQKIILEDESVMIGKCIVPRVLFDRMMTAPIVVVEKTVEERADSIINEYVFERIRDLKEDPEQVLAELSLALSRVAKKLGGVRFLEMKRSLEDAFQSSDQNDPGAHRKWVAPLLEFYYDPAYSRGLEKRKGQIVFRGPEQECKDFLETSVKR